MENLLYISGMRNRNDYDMALPAAPGFDLRLKARIVLHTES